MSTKLRPLKPKKRPPHWRKPEDVKLSEEVCDLKHDIALQLEADSGMKTDQTHAYDKQPERQEHVKAGTDNSNNQANNLSQESLECDIVSSDISAHGIRALNHAGGYITRLDAVQEALTTQARPKKANIGLEHDLTSPNISAHGMRALNHADGRITQLHVAQDPTTQVKPKKAACLHFGILSL
ncbi:hypothetical protein EI94DRAFT_1708156 [Lactarius quietus]|nr:hypothetical protein EI94DRAFT_1708156 [Lactarius quietus]